jgi:hypothetical protein
MSNATPERQKTITLEITDEVAVCLVFFEIFPLVLEHRLKVSKKDFVMAYLHSLNAMTSMVRDDPKLFRETAIDAIKRLARMPNEFGRQGISMEEAIAAFKGDGSCPDGVDPENWESLVQ